MSQFFAYSLFGTLALCFVAGIASFALFDRLLRILFYEHHAKWEQQGRPPGFLWMPRGANLWSGSFARGNLLTQWTRQAPGWMAASGSALALHRQFQRVSRTSRILLGIYIVQFAAWFLFVLTGGFHR